MWSIFILILTGVPGTALPKIGNFWDWMRPDKVIHILLFGVFFYLLSKGTAKKIGAVKLAIKRILALLLIGIVFAALTEILQAKLFIHRNGSLYDFIANVIGCLIGLSIYLILTKKKQIKLETNKIF